VPVRFSFDIRQIGNQQKSGTDRVLFKNFYGVGNGDKLVKILNKGMAK